MQLLVIFGDGATTNDMSSKAVGRTAGDPFFLVRIGHLSPVGDVIQTDLQMQHQ